MTPVQRRLKRVIDLVIAVVALTLTAPVVALVALMIRFRLGSPVIFRQQRTGLHGRVFELTKFRTMTDATDAAGRLLPDEERLTTFGSALRSSSLDEMPQLLNVIRGDMSIVGPRPLLVDYLDRYTAKQMRRHEVLPGVTGLAQVSGRNSLSWEEQFDLDVQYVDTWSLRQDFKIMARTFVELIRRDSERTGGGIIKEDFMGSDVTAAQEESGEDS